MPASRKVNLLAAAAQLTRPPILALATSPRYTAVTKISGTLMAVVIEAAGLAARTGEGGEVGGGGRPRPEAEK